MAFRLLGDGRGRIGCCTACVCRVRASGRTTLRAGRLSRLRGVLTGAMSENLETVRRGFDAFNRRDVDLLG
jgi:hypothetical protein